MDEGERSYRLEPLEPRLLLSTSGLSVEDLAAAGATSFDTETAVDIGADEQVAITNQTNAKYSPEQQLASLFETSLGTPEEEARSEEPAPAGGSEQIAVAVEETTQVDGGDEDEGAEAAPGADEQSDPSETLVETLTAAEPPPRVADPPDGWWEESASFGGEQILLRLSEAVDGLVAAEAPDAPIEGEALTAADLTPVAAGAVSRWVASGLLDEAAIEQLARISFTIADLSGLKLGAASGAAVTIDDDAAGWGWFVDATPADDSDLDAGAGRMDLLTVVTHEIGHVVGYEHADEGLMAPTLDPGVRQTPDERVESLVASQPPPEYGYVIDPEGSIDIPGEMDQFIFTLTRETSLYFDSLTNDYNLSWDLVGPRGEVVADRGFSSSDSYSLSGNPLLELVAGQYELTVDGNADATGSYGFRLLDLGQATMIELGVEVSGTLNPANATDAYRFTGQGGQRCYFDIQESSQYGKWQLLDPYGQLVFGSDYAYYFYDMEAEPLPFDGVYTLLFEGGVGNTGTASYRFTVQPVTDERISLQLGALAAGAIDHAGQRDVYQISLAEAKWVWFDSLTNDYSLSWDLVGPRGEVVADRGFSSSDSYSLSGNPLLQLVAGQYELTVDGNADATGSYGFRLLDLGQTTLIEAGVEVSGTLEPGNETEVYSFSAVAGDLVIFDRTALSGGNPYWRLLNPYGGLVFGPESFNDRSALKLLQSGEYTLLLEGPVWDGGSMTYSFAMQSVGHEEIPPAVGVDLALGGTVSGAISAAAEVDNHLFSLGGPASLYFDALTNNSSMSWSLTGPRGVEGNRGFTSSDSSSYGGNPVMNVTAGDYVLAVRGTGTATGSYSFRLLDIGQATLIEAGVEVGGELSPANATDAYRFTVQGGERYYFDSTVSTYAAFWRLLDPYGQLVFGPSGMYGDVDVLELPFDGDYTLLVEGQVGASGTTSYGVRVQKVTDELSALQLGVVAAGAIDHAGQRDVYEFSLAEAKWVWFDSLTDDYNLSWDLVGPRGEMVTDRSFSYSDSANLGGNLLLQLVAGQYELTVDGNADATGSYGFRLLDLGQTTLIEAGVEVSGTLEPANATDAYRFAVQGGERYYFDSTVSTYAAFWRLLDPYGQLVFGPSGMYGDVDVLELPFDGDYTLLVEGQVGASGTTSYGVRVQKVTDELSALQLGVVAAGAIDHAGQRDVYEFSLAEAKWVWFDSLTDDYNLSWDLVGPRGEMVTDRSFSYSDSANLGGNLLLQLVAGQYELTVDGNADATGSYGFRLLDLGQATLIEAGVEVSGTLEPANATDAYRFAVQGGERYYFDSTVSTYAAFWRLLDPYGQLVFGPSGMYGDVDVLELPFDGDYTLLVEGQVGASGTTSYGVRVQKVTDELSALQLGVVAAGAIDHAGQRDVYEFSLAEAKWVWFDSLTDDYNLSWDLVGPRGEMVTDRSFSYSDSANLGGNLLLQLVAGQYELTVDGNADATGSYGFRLLDLGQTTLIEAGVEVSGTLEPANATDAYRFAVQGGERYYFDSTVSTYAAFWRLLDPYGQLVFGPSGMYGDVDVLELPFDGDYTLLVEGQVGASGTTSYGVRVQKVTDELSALQLGVVAAGAIDHAGQRDVYEFSLAEAKWVWFDSLTDDYNLSWDLVGPRGEMVTDRSFSYSDSANLGGNLLLQLVAGQYELTVDGNADATGSYGFRLLDLGQATLIEAGVEVSGTLEPANETEVYSFGAVAGDLVSFDRTTLSGGYPYWRLLNPYGGLVFGPESFNDRSVLKLVQSGEYTLLMEGGISDSGTVTYGFAMQSGGHEDIVPPTGVALVLGTTVSGAISAAGEVDNHLFSLSGPASLYLDALTNNSSMRWSLTGPRGLEGTRGFTGSDSSSYSGNPVMSVPAGDYVLAVWAAGTATGSYGFRLLDLSQATMIELGVEVSGTLSPASATDAYRFTGQAGQRCYFDIQESSQYGMERLLDPYGQLVLGSETSSYYFFSDVETEPLPFDGVYTLLFEGGVGNTGTASYRFTVQPETDERISLQLGALAAGCD